MIAKCMVAASEPQSISRAECQVGWRRVSANKNRESLDKVHVIKQVIRVSNGRRAGCRFLRPERTKRSGLTSNACATEADIWGGGGLSVPRGWQRLHFVIGSRARVGRSGRLWYLDFEREKVSWSLRFAALELDVGLKGLLESWEGQDERVARTLGLGLWRKGGEALRAAGRLALVRQLLQRVESRDGMEAGAAAA